MQLEVRGGKKHLTDSTGGEGSDRDLETVHYGWASQIRQAKKTGYA